MSRATRIIQKVAISFVTVLAVVGLSATPALAGGPIVYNQRGGSIAMRWAPTTNAGVTHWLPQSSRFLMVCYTDFQWYNGNYNSNRWFYGQTFAGGYYGYVHSSYVYYQTRVPHC